MESNPYNLKVLDEKPSGYLSAEEFVDFLKNHMMRWLKFFFIVSTSVC